MTVLTPQPSTRKFAGLPLLNIDDELDYGVCMAIYGPGGAGKTTLAAGCVNSELGRPALYLDAEGGAQSITHLRDIDRVRVTNWSQIRSAVNELVRNPDHGYKSLILDNMTEFQTLSINEIVGTDDVQIQHWGKCTRDMLRLTRVVRDLSQDQGVNVFLLAWEDLDKDLATGAVRRGVGFTPSLARQFPGIVNIVGYVSVMQNPPTYTRVLSFAPSPKTDAKFRRSPTEAARSIPLEIPYGEGNIPMADLLATLKGGKAFPADKYSVPKRGTSP